MVGATVDGKYELVRLLGEGGMGAVHEARHLGTGRRVALKLISPEALERSPDIAARFDREARASGQVESKHVAQVIDTGRDAQTGSPYLVMELLRGEDLSQLLERAGELEPEIALRIVAQALAGLSKAHVSGIVHRDIKPANVFLAQGESDEVVVKILDFGIAKVRADPLRAERKEDVALTRTGSMLGSPLYMSPEQARSAKQLDHRCDLWAMGIVLHEALAGRTPYGDVETIGGLILEICSGVHRNVQELAPWVSPEIAKIIHRALLPNIHARYQSADEMLADVRALLPNGVTLTTSMLAPLSRESRTSVAPKFVTSGVSPFARTEGHATPEPAVTTHSAFAQSQSKPGSRWPLFAGLAAIALGGAGVGLYMFANHKIEPPPIPAIPTITQSIMTVAPSASLVPADRVAPAISTAVAASTAPPVATTTKPVVTSKPSAPAASTIAKPNPTGSQIQPDRSM